MSAVSPASFPSERRLAANRANAQLSSGPKTSEGKAVSSRNALKTGLTGRTVLLPSEDADAYELHLLHYLEECQPLGHRETELVQHLADTEWRLRRIPSLEAGFYALGRLKYADQCPDPELLDAYIAQQDAKHFKNLHLQESRLRRQSKQDAQELKDLQAQRKKEQEEKTAQTTAAKAPAAAPNGFEFATPTSQPQNSRETGTDNKFIDPGQE